MWSVANARRRPCCRRSRPGAPRPHRRWPPVPPRLRRPDDPGRTTLGRTMFQQELSPVAGSLIVSALIALLPLLTIFVLLGVLRIKAHWAGLASLGVAILVAFAAFGMPFGLTLLSATEGAVFG